MKRSKPVPSQLRHLGGLRHAPVTEHDAGVYFLVSAGTVVYVGQSTTPRSRIANHIQAGEKQFDDAWIRHCDVGELDTLESMFIHHLQPKYNASMAGERKCAPLPFDAVRAHVEALADRLVVADKPQNARRMQYGTRDANTQRLLRLPEVIDRVGLKRSAIYEHMQLGRFPRCVKFGRAVMWPENQLNDWIAARLVAPAGIEPASAP